jgi:hypothetical protein
MSLSIRQSGKRMSPDPISVFAQIIVVLRLRYRFIEPAKCAMPHGAGWYVFAVDGDAPRELNDGEEAVVNKFRLGMTPITSTPRTGART